VEGHLKFSPPGIPFGITLSTSPCLLPNPPPNSFACWFLILATFSKPIELFAFPSEFFLPASPPPRSLSLRATCASAIHFSLSNFSFRFRAQLFSRLFLYLSFFSLFLSLSLSLSPRHKQAPCSVQLSVKRYLLENYKRHYTES